MNVWCFESLCASSSIPFKKPHTFPKQPTKIIQNPSNKHPFTPPAASIRAISCGSVTRWAWLKTMFGSCCGAWPLWSSTVQAPTRATRESPMLHSTACCPSGDSNATEAVVPRPEMNKRLIKCHKKSANSKSFQNRLLDFCQILHQAATKIQIVLLLSKLHIELVQTFQSTLQRCRRNGAQLFAGVHLSKGSLINQSRSRSRLAKWKLCFKKLLHQKTNLKRSVVVWFLGDAPLVCLFFC